MKINHKTMSVVDILRLLAELEHMRFHCLISATSAKDEDTIGLLVLANQCQNTRREIQKHYFPDVTETYWCMVKSAARMLQIMEETADGDLNEIKCVKQIIDSAIALSTGEDISNCESCRKDFNEIA